MTRGDLGAGALALTAALLTAVAVAAGPPEAPAATAPAPERAVPLRAVTLACPRNAAGADGELVSVAAPLGSTARSRSGVLLLPLEPRGDPLAAQTKAGALAVRGRTAVSPDVVSASGELAPALTVTRAVTAADGRRRRVSVASCLPAGQQWLFVGAGSSVDHRSSLVLVNPEPSLAVVDVRIFGPGGAVRTVGAQGVAVAPHSRRVLDLAALARARAELAVAVAVTQGRVFAAVHDRWADELKPAGVEWLQPAVGAARNSVVAGVPGSPGAKELVVVNPSNGNAVVEVQLLGPNGAFEPTGLSPLQLPPGSVLTESLTAAVAGDAVAVRLRSDQPVTAAVRTTTTGQGGSDIAVVPASDPIETAAVLPVFADLRLQLLLTNPARAAATAAVTAYAANGEAQARRVLRLGGGTTRTLAVPTDRDVARPAYVVVRPRSGGEVLGAGFYTRTGPTAGASSLPMRSVLVSVHRPSVRPVLTEPR